MDVRIGITGSGHTSHRNAVRLVGDLLAKHPDDRITFIVDFSTDEEGQLTPAAGSISKWALSQGYIVEGFMLVGETSAAMAEFASDLKLQAVANPPAAVVRQSTVVLIAWDDQDDAMRALLAADKHGVPAYDLTDGMLRLGFDDTEEPQEPPAEADPPFVPDVRTDDSPSAEQPVSEQTAGEPEAPTPKLATADLDTLAEAIATRVIEAITPLLPVRRGPGRPRKTPIQE